MSCPRLLVSMLLAGAAALSACADESQEPTAPEEPSQTVGPRAQNTLLANADQAQSAMNSEQQSHLTGIQGREWAAEVHMAQLASNPSSMLGDGREIGIDVSPTQHYVVIIERHTVHESGNISWHGTVRDSTGEFRLTIGSNEGWGELIVGKNQYMIEPVGNGLHAIVLTDPSGFGIEREPLTTMQDNIKPSVPLQLGQSTPGKTRQKILILRTPRVDNQDGASNVFYDDLIAAANASYAPSGVNLTLIRQSITGSQGIADYDEVALGGNYEAHLNRLTSPNDGHMDGLHGSRNTQFGDVVVLLIDDRTDADGNGRVAGIAWQHPRADHAFAVVQWNDAIPSRVFAHEIGHVQGAMHDTGTPTFSYGRGYVDPDGDFRTIMAGFAGCGSCPRINRWANPNKTYNGKTTGTSSRNNARVLNETAARVSAFRSAISISGKNPIWRYVSGCTYGANVPDGMEPTGYRWYWGDFNLGSITQTFTLRGNFGGPSVWIWLSALDANGRGDWANFEVGLSDSEIYRCFG